jgi:hypothetical protein
MFTMERKHDGLILGVFFLGLGEKKRAAWKKGYDGGI